jgi:hypothetical protein
MQLVANMIAKPDFAVRDSILTILIFLKPPKALMKDRYSKYLLDVAKYKLRFYDTHNIRCTK